jgi:hypothetical protein
MRRDWREVRAWFYRERIGMKRIETRDGGGFMRRGGGRFEAVRAKGG